MPKGRNLGVLADTDHLLAFLQTTLEDIEAAEGGEDAECRAKLQQLTTLLAGQQGPGQQQQQLRQQQLDELELASQIDTLEQQLAIVSEQLGSATLETRQMLSAGATMWAGPSGVSTGADGHDSADEAATAEEAGPDAGDEAPAAAVEEEGHAAAAPPESLHALAIVEEEEEGTGAAPCEASTVKPPPE